MKFALRYIRSLSVLAVLAVTVPAGSHAASEHATDQARLFFAVQKPVVLVKSGTPRLIELLTGDTDEARAFKASYALAARPSMQAFADSPEGHFRVHYDSTGYNAPPAIDVNHNGVPDYVDSTLVYLEDAWHFMVVEQGYGQPRGDGTRGGEPRDTIDCYLMELAGQSLYGYTSPDASIGGTTSSYLTIDNNFSDMVYPTKGYAALKITTAHEFFHVIHYSYYGGMDVVWWMEHSAVWMEDRMWDDVNDYLNYVSVLFTERDTPLDSSNGIFEYGASLFAFHIAKEYGEDYIRLLWREFGDRQTGTIETMNPVLPKGLSQAVGDLGAWLYFTGSRANPATYFNDGGLFRYSIQPDVVITGNTGSGSISARHYTYSYINFTPNGGLSAGDSLYVNIHPADSGDWTGRLILYDGPTASSILTLQPGMTGLKCPSYYQRAVLVLANTTALNTTNTITYDIRLIPPKSVEDDPRPQLTGLGRNVPNPFNPTTSISFTLGERSPVRLRVVNLSGQVVAVLADDIRAPGDYSVVFNAASLASGVYIAVLETGTRITTRKMTLIR